MSKQVAEVMKQIEPEFSIEPFASLTNSTIDEVLKQHNKDKCREGTILTPQIMIWFVLAITLRRDLNYHKALDWILSGFRWTMLTIPKLIVKAGAFTHARVKMGIDVFRDLFYKLTEKFSDTEPDFYGFSTVMFDGSSLTMPDTESNIEKFGKHKSGRGKGGFPQMRVVALMILSSRRIVDVAYAACKGKKTGEKTLMFKILKRCKLNFLFLFDAGFYSFTLAKFMMENQVNFIMKVSSSLKLKVIPGSRRTDGSYLSKIKCKVVESVNPITGRKKWKTEEITVRVIKFKIPGFRPVRLITSLLDTEITAKEIAIHYHKRWDIEIAYDEIKTHQCATLKGQMPTIFRSKRADLVEQELYAILISYNLVRSTIKEATDKKGGNPLLISFLDTLQIIIDGAPIIITMESKMKNRALDYMYKMISESHIDRPRRSRCNPRVVKVKMSNFRKKRKTDKSAYRNFEQDIQIINKKAA